MTKHRNEEGFAHNPDAIPGVDTKVTRHADGDVTVSFGDGSEDLNVSRRDFMRISGVAAATAAMSGAACRNPVETIVPFVDRPEEIRVGHANEYATICTACPAQCGAVVTTRGGRPVKLDGNPRHPVSKGALCARGQASYLDMYDPDRARGPLQVAEGGAHRKMTWEEVDRDVATQIEKARSGGGIAILTRTISGAARKALIDEVTGSIANARHYTYEPFNSEALLNASEIAYGDRHVPHYRFDQADVIVSFGSDFLGTWLSPVEFTKQFSSRRDPEGNFNKLIVFEGNMSLTGMNADDRYRVRPSDLPTIALGVAHEVIVAKKSGGLASDPRVVNALKAFSADKVAEVTGVSADALKDAAQRLIDARGKSIVVAGGVASAVRGGVSLELAVSMLNATLGNVGRTVERARASRQAQGSLADIQALIADIEAGKVDMLIVDGANPVYHLPDSLGFAKALESVKYIVSTSDRVDETSRYADVLAAGSHSLECWGDSQPYEGVFTIQQPALSSLHDTRAFEESLITWFGKSKAVSGLESYLEVPAAPMGNRGPNVPTNPGAWYRYLRAFWEKTIFPKAGSLAGFDRFWTDILRQGHFTVPGTEQNRAVRFDPAKAVAALPTSLPEAKTPSSGLDGKEIQLTATIGLYDGSQANNGHLQELPDPVTKMVWGSYAQVSPKTFRDANLEMGQHVELTVNGKKRTFPVMIQPGLHDDVVAVPLGYGRTGAGVVGNDVGENTFLFSQIDENRQIFAGIAIEALKALDTSEPLPTVQGGDIIDLHRRGLFGKASLEDFKKNPEAGIHAHPPLPDLWEAHEYEVKWGMAIDLSKCTGCSACVVACQEENNVPVVGKQGVLEGREMHWLRVDRYFELPYEAAKLQKSPTNDPMFDAQPVVAFSEYIEDQPRVVWQPMMCQHCENAPCETVCPVSATMHSSDGLNQMVYNRCVGTRYCANNCPFKVRRFNWFNYSQDRSESFFARLYPELKEHSRLNVAEPLPKGMNPEVTVRSRGVMEKCTFCVQRIRRAKWQLRKENRAQYRDGDVITACQQACPADAIEFGNLVDENSKVAKLHANMRAHQPLKELGVESSVAYLTRIVNSERDNAHHGGGHGGDHGADHKQDHAEEAAH